MIFLKIEVFVLLFLALVFLLALEKSAFAYLDPGTGSYVFQIIIAGIVGSLFAIKMFWKRFIGFFKNGPLKKKEKNEK